MRIGEVAAATTTTTKTLRFYEERGLLPAAARASNGYREYGEDAVARVNFIRRSRISGLTLTQIDGILRVRDAGTAPCAHVTDALENQIHDLDQKIAELHALRATVSGYRDAVASADPAGCDPARICSYL